MRLTQLSLEHFKAFERFDLRLGTDAFLVGPNNAGKSTLIAAMRSASRMLAIARLRKPTAFHDHRGFGVWAHPFNDEALGLVAENLRYQFENQETLIRLSMDSGLQLSAVWPERPVEDSVEESQGDPDPYFYVWGRKKVAIRDPRDVRAMSPEVGVVPGLYPLNRTETVRDVKYLRSEVEGRRSSQHARNHLYQLQRDGEFDAFRSFALSWLPELATIEVADPQEGSKPGDWELDVFVREKGDRRSKELFWFGDGLQVFVQILYHMWRLRGADVVVLDEPDLYLHADLQRRLVRLLDSVESQTITATHSPEMLAEASADAVIWVDKSRRRGVARPDPASLNDLSTQIGSAFNLRLATALRARTVLFVEGDDMAILRRVAETVGAENVALERNCAVISMSGFTNWSHVEPFKWLLSEFLDDSVEVFVVLDRDYLSEEEILGIETTLSGSGVRPHVWRRKELESYLIEPETIARSCRLEVTNVLARLASVTSAMESKVRSQFVADALRRREKRIAEATIIERANAQFDADATPEWRLKRFPAKEILSGFNRGLQQDALKAVSDGRLARTIKLEEIDPEMVDLLRAVEASCSG